MTERQLKEIAFALLYHRLFKHGTDGHNRLMLIAEQAAEAGYQLEVDIHTEVAADVSEPDAGFEVGVFVCLLVLKKNGETVLTLDNLAKDGEE